MCIACACVPTRWVLHLASACVYHYLLCFDGFLMFAMFICVFFAANKTQGRVCAESNLYPFYAVGLLR